MMKKIENIILISFLLVLSFVPFLWLSGGQLVLGYDAVFPLNPIAFLTDRLYSWTTTQGFSIDQSGIQGSLIIHFIDSIPYFFGFSAEYAQKIVFSFWFFAILFSSFIFIVRIERSGFVKSRYLRYFFPVLYTFNFYLLQAWWAIERTKFSLVVALPLILSIILPMIRGDLSLGKIVKYSALCALILAVFNGGGWVGLPLYGGLFVVLGCYYIFFGLVFFLNRKVKNLIPLSLFFVFLFLWYALLNAYTLLPFFLTTVKSYGEIVASAGGITGLIDWTRYLSENVTFLNLFRLQGIPDWYNNGRFHPYSYIYLNNPFFIFYSFLAPLFVFLSFLNKKNREDKLLLPFLLLVLIISGFFTAGAHPPLGFAFEFLMRTVPGFVAFRSAIFKFGYAYWFAVGFFISLFLSNFLAIYLSKIKNVKIYSFLVITSPIIIIILILLYHFPFLTGNIFRIDPTHISARVNMPSYISEFTKWWKNQGKTDKILLLPKLNDDWLFEQYRWNYMSLFPITGNFASRGIVENAVILTESENAAITDLYDAINTKNYQKVNFLSSTLGIRYFLVRRDFYYDYPDQTTDDPMLVEENLIQNPSIQKVVEFGKWIVYRHVDSKPIITIKNSAVLISGGVNFDQLLTLKGNHAFIIDQGISDRPSQSYSGFLFNPSCLNCLAEREERRIFFPKPRVLIDSNLYQLVELRDKLFLKRGETLEEKNNRFLGITIKLMGQIEQLIEQDKDPYYLDIAKNKYIKAISEILDNVPPIFNESNNPYSKTILIRQYLDQEEKLLNTLISSRVERREILKTLGEALQAIQSLKNKLAQYYDSDSAYNRERIYSLIIENSGEYNVTVNKDSVGNLRTSDIESLLLSVDKQATRSGKIIDSHIDFGSVDMEKGSHTIILSLPPQQTAVSSPRLEKMVGKDCYSYFINNFSSKKSYSLQFNSKNNFDPGFFFFIDYGSFFSPIVLNKIPISGEQVKSNKMVISSETMSLDERVKRLRISFCASVFTEELFKNNIQDLSLVELTSPSLYLSKDIKDSFVASPQVSFKEVNQAHFKVFVKNARAPYYLVFSQRNELGWEANIGKPMTGGKFENVWYINREGSYEIDLVYGPQRYFDMGLMISGISLIVVLGIIGWRRKYA